MRISFLCNPVYINGGWSPWDTRVGGSEECIVQWSKRLAKDHEVQVFHNGQHGEYEGVQYKPHEDYEPGDVTINVNYPQFPVQGPTVYYTTLTENPDLSAFTAVACLSEYAKNSTDLPSRTVIVPPGLDPSRIYPQAKIPKQCFYASSPDRGLELLLQVWPEVYKVHPDATLIVTYGGNIDLPGVINLGEVDEDTMDDVYRTSDIWCHPCTGSELFCITGKKAQAAGCIPVIIPTMALQETVARGFKTDAEHYAQTLIEVLDTSPGIRDAIRKDVTAHANALSWEQSTDKLLEIVNNVII